MDSRNIIPNTATHDYSQVQNGRPIHSYLSDEKPFNWQKFAFLFLRNWYWFLITIGIALGIAFYKIRYTIPKYQATATLILEEEENTQDVLGQLRAVRYWRRQVDMANERAKLSSFTTIKRTVDSLDQDVFWTGHGRIRIRPIYKNPFYSIQVFNDTISWYKGKQWYIDYIDNSNFRLYQGDNLDTILPFNKKIILNDWQFLIHKKPGNFGHQTYSFVLNDMISLTNHYKQKLQIETDEKAGSVILLKSVGSVGNREVDFLNTLCQTYINSGLERKQQIAENTFVFIDDQIEVILDSLNKAENQLLVFRLSNNVINLSQEGEIAFQRLKTFHEQRTQLKIAENYFHYLQNYIEKRENPQTIIAPSMVDVGDQLLISAVQELQKLYEERENLDFTVMNNSPGIENINERIIGVRLRILEIVSGLIENNRLTMEQLEIEESAIIDQLKVLPINEQQLLNIKRKYDLYNQFYTFLLQKRAEAGIQKASTISNVRILDPSRYDQLVTIGKDRKIILLIALFMGFLIPIIILYLRDRLNNRIRELEDIVNNSTIPIIGIIGHSNVEGVMPIKEDPNTSFAESLRRIRTNIKFALPESEQNVIMVTSSISGEGKSFSAANLATIIALNHRKVLLIGCDMRKPTLHKIFDIQNSVGVTSYIIGEAELDEITFKTQIENLYVMPSGPVPPNPAEMIETKKMKDLFTQAKKDFDFVIIDTPPIALVADALALATYADMTLYLVRQNFSHKGVLEIANSLMNEEKLPKTYLMINDIKPSKGIGINYYYGYGKGYMYGYNSYSKEYYSDSE